MLIKIPGNKDLQLEHLVLDFNGTLACDGRLIQGVRERLKAMADQIKIHVLTADTFGGVA
jgi:soluble P-type ATPase